MYAWGANSSGQLGLGDTDSALAPLRVKALANKKVIQVSAGDKFSAAVTGMLSSIVLIIFQR